MNATQPENNELTLEQKLGIFEDLAYQLAGDVVVAPLVDGKPNFDARLDDLRLVSYRNSDLENTADIERLCILTANFDIHTRNSADASAAFVTYLDLDTNLATHRQVRGSQDSTVRCLAALRRGLNGKPMQLEPEAPANDNEPQESRTLPAVPKMCADPLSPESAGGLLADIATWITETAIVPVPELSMVSAIALVAGMFGNRLLGPTKSGLNLYLTTLMGTAGGKGHPPKAIRKLAELSGKQGAVTNGDHTSYAALERTLRRNPSTVITMDEFGITLQDVNGKHTSSPAASIRKFLLAVYDQADAIFDGRIYASDEAKKDDSSIVGPALTVLGITTPETLFAGLSEASISDGFINRFLFVTGTAPKIIRPPKLLRNDSVPAPLLSSLKDANESSPRGNGLGGKYVVPIDGGEDGAAYRRWLEVFNWQHSPAWTATEQGINGRAAENAIKLATIRAVSRNAKEPVVSIEDVEWGWAIVYASINLVTSGAEKHMSASPAEALRKAIIAALAEAPNDTLAFSKLLERRGVRGAQHYELEGALRWLTEAERIRDVSGRKVPGKGSKFVLTA